MGSSERDYGREPVNGTAGVSGARDDEHGAVGLKILPRDKTKISGLIGLFASSRHDLARRAKDIARGRDTV